MNKIMVCVTGQKTCQRLIDFGNQIKKCAEDKMYIIHVTQKNRNFLGNSAEGEALEFLFEKAREAGADLTVEKADDVVGTLIELVEENQINEVIVGESGEAPGPDNFLEKLKQGLGNKAEVIEVAAVS